VNRELIDAEPGGAHPVLRQFVIGGLVIAAAVLVQAAAQAGLLAWLRGRRELSARASSLRAAGLVVAAVAALFAGHVVQIWLWALLFLALGEFATAVDAVYFSTVSFTTVGYGDVVLSPGARLLGAIEAANGMLLFGWSTALLFEIIRRVHKEG
jgi:voltage-gated potassium channel